MEQIYLPIGSIVVLEENPELELIIIRQDVTIEKIHKDYLCNIISNNDDKLKFVHIDEAEISKVLFMGYQR